jgi:inner membrane protein involved in colicin E2 resistance
MANSCALHARFTAVVQRGAAMDTATPSLPVAPAPAAARRNQTTLKLVFIAVLVIALQFPLFLVNSLRQERMAHRGLAAAAAAGVGRADARAPADRSDTGAAAGSPAAEGYRMVERALKHGVLVLALVFAEFFLFEILAGLRLHPVQYSLVGAALCLFYLALLALGEVTEPGPAYIGAAVASSALITLYSAAILRSRGRAAIIWALLAAVFGALYVVLRMEDFALLAGTAALFVALGAVMYCTRHIDWHARDNGGALAK